MSDMLMIIINSYAGAKVHGGIDGYSQTVTFLKCSTNNQASIAFAALYQGVERYGTPKKVCTDHGGENMETAIHVRKSR